MCKGVDANAKRVRGGECRLAVDAALNAAADKSVAWDPERCKTLPNGAEVLRRAYRQGCGWLFLAKWTKNGHDEWVTWWADGEGDCYWGHYFWAGDRAAELADADFERRLGMRGAN